MAIRHKKTSIVPDSANPNNVRPSDWNDDHEGMNVHSHVDSESGGNLSHEVLSNIGINTHSEIDSALSRLANTSGSNTGDQTFTIIGNNVMSGTTGSTVIHNESGVISGSYNQVEVDEFGHIISASVVPSGGVSEIIGEGVMSDTSGSVVIHNDSGASPGNYLSANITVDSTGHVTAVSNGTSASSVGAPADSPFITSGSATGLTDYSVLTAGSNISVVRSGSIITVHSTASGTTIINGSGIMSDTSGSTVKHNLSGIISGSYNIIKTDLYGHITEGSSISYQTQSEILGLDVMSDTSGSIVQHNDSNVSPGDYNRVTVDVKGHVTQGSSLSYQTVSSVVGIDVMSNTSGSIISHNDSDVIPGDYNKISVNQKGHITSGSNVEYLTDIEGISPISVASGSQVSHDSSGVGAGSYLSANITVDEYGHITAATSGTSASSTGAPADSPFITSGSVTGLTDYAVLTAGSNISINKSGSIITVHSMASGTTEVSDDTTPQLGGNLDLNTFSILDQSKFVCNGRLTLETGVPVSTTGQTDKTNLYFTPYNGNEISLYNGANWIRHTFTELTLAVGAFTASKPYDIFIYNNAGTLTLSGEVWTNATTRATALATQDGVYVKTGATNYRYLGTIYIAADQKCDDSLTERFVWNYYNRVNRRLYVNNEAPHTYNGPARLWNNSNTNNLLQLVTGVAEDGLQLGWVANAKSGADGSKTDVRLYISGVAFSILYDNYNQQYLLGGGSLMLALTTGYSYYEIYQIGAHDGCTFSSFKLTFMTRM